MPRSDSRVVLLVGDPKDMQFKAVKGKTVSSLKDQLTFEDYEVVNVPATEEAVLRQLEEYSGRPASVFFFAREEPRLRRWWRWWCNLPDRDQELDKLFQLISQVHTLKVVMESELFVLFLITISNNNLYYRAMEAGCEGCYPKLGMQEFKAYLAFARRTLDVGIRARTRQEDALKDPLTGCFNRRAFHEIGGTIFAKILRPPVGQSPSPISVMVVDLDYFKPINDKYGHPVGDEALKVVGDTHHKVIHRHGDLYVRMGGDEWVTILSNANADQAQKRADKLGELLASAEVVDPSTGVVIPEVKLSATIGIATRDPACPESMKIETLDELYTLADAAMVAKKSERGILR